MLVNCSGLSFLVYTWHLFQVQLGSLMGCTITLHCFATPAKKASEEALKCVGEYWVANILCITPCTCIHTGANGAKI